MWVIQHQEKIVIEYAQEGYQQNAVVYKCINEIANGASAVDLCVYDDDIKLDFTSKFT